MQNLHFPKHAKVSAGCASATPGGSLDSYSSLFLTVLCLDDLKLRIVEHADDDCPFSRPLRSFTSI